MNRLLQLLLLALVAVISGCGDQPRTVAPVIESVAPARKLSDGSYEVQLRYSVTTSGGPCLSKDWFKTRTNYSTNWLYVKALEGVMTADQIVVTTDAGKKEWPYAHTNLQGTVSFTNTTMLVRLEHPGYDDKRNIEIGYVPYFLNGTYQISERALDINAVALLSRAPAIEGVSYRCRDMVRAVNALRHLGKEDALAILKNHLRQNDRYASPDQCWKLHLVCRLLFVNPQGWKFPRLGQPEPAIDWNIGEHLPQFPLLVSNGVPFLLVSGYSAGGFTSDTPEKTVELCEGFALIPADLSEIGYEKAAQDVIGSQMFQKLYSTPASRKEAADMLLVQAGAKEPQKLEGTSTITVTITPASEDKK